MILALSPDDVDILINRTIDQQKSIGILDLVLRDLRTKKVNYKNRETNLLIMLEQHITVHHIRRLILNNGTTFELFRFLSHSSYSRSIELINVINHEDIEELIEQTIKQNRSIESIHLAFLTIRKHKNLLENILGLLSSDLFAKLIIKAGTFNSLTQITNVLPVKYANEIREVISRFPVEDWKNFVLRGVVGNLTRFISSDINKYPVSVQNILENIVQDAGYEYLMGSSWYELNTAVFDGEGVIFSSLRKSLDDYLHSVSEEEILKLSFKEATSAFSILWEYAEEWHDFLNRNLWEILNKEQWPKDYSFSLIRHVLWHISHKDFHNPNARRLLKEVRKFERQLDWKNAKPHTIFHFFWHFWQASHELSPQHLQNILQMSC